MAKVRGRSAGDDSIGIFNFMELESHINSRGRKTRHEELPDSEIDHLSLMAREAKRHGYGCHYGNYIADFHPTLQKSVEPEIDDDEWLQDPSNKICPICGARFTSKRKDRMYCSDACRFTSQKIRDMQGIKSGRHTRPIKVTDEEGNILHFDSLRNACRGTGISWFGASKSLDTGEEYRGILFQDDEERSDKDGEVDD